MNVQGGRSLLRPTALAVAFVLLMMFFPPGRASARETIVGIEPPSHDVLLDTTSFTVDIVIKDVENLAAFEFTLRFDPTILSHVSVHQGTFLASTGRRVSCLSPILEPDSVRFGCVTEGGRPPGPDGSGVLATVTFSPQGTGTSALTFTRLELADPLSAEAGEAGALMGTCRDGVVRVLAPGEPTPSSPAPTPTPAPHPLAPTPIPGAPTPFIGELLPAQGPGSATSDQGLSPEPASAGQLNGGVGSPAGGAPAGEAEENERFPIAGTGPATKDAFPLASAIGAGLAVAGVAALIAPVALKRRRNTRS